MLKMNLITQKELYWALSWELDRELYGELYGDLYRGMRQPLEFQIRADFSHSKISRV
jgi:hypothetical protein